MAGQSSAMIGWSWTDVSVLGSQVFRQALMDSCATAPANNCEFYFLSKNYKKLPHVSKEKWFVSFAIFGFLIRPEASSPDS